MGIVSWRAGFMLGLLTTVFGIILAFRPTQSLNVFAVLLGVVMLISGAYHIVRAIGGHEQHRVWRGLAGVCFILIGLAFLRHLHLSVALIGLFVGFTWVIQGIGALVEVFAGRRSGEAGWSVFYGIVSLIAGIVVIAIPIESVGVMTIFLGCWFILMGIMEMLGAWSVRHFEDAVADTDAISGREAAADGGDVSVPQQRATVTDEATAEGQARPGATA
jgi:uncharacterized membrane protein HdeD (DUF308 family)